jgi:hypothetical protein
MTLERRHLHIAIALLVAAVVYNVFTWARGRSTSVARADQQAPLLAGVVPQARPSTWFGETAADPAAIPAPPRVDVSGTPRWSNDPFLAPGESRRAPVVAMAVQPDVADPVVRTILYAADRHLAIVDDRIVRVGDVVSAGTIVDIARDAIVVRTATGATRRVELRRGPSRQAFVK